MIKPYIEASDNLFYFRAPYGDVNDTIIDILNGDSRLSNYVGPFYWNIGGAKVSGYSADWASWRDGDSIEQCAQGYLKEALDKRAGIVLMHENDDNNYPGPDDPGPDKPGWCDLRNPKHQTLELVKYLVPLLKDRGFRFCGLEAVPTVANAHRQMGKANAAPPNWFHPDIIRNEKVHWHRVTVAPGVAFERATNSDKLYYRMATVMNPLNGFEIGGLGKEIAGRQDAQGNVFLFVMGAEYLPKIWYQKVPPGGLPDSNWSEFASGIGLSCFSRLHLIPETQTLKFEWWDSSSPPQLRGKVQVSPGADQWADG